MPVRVALCVVCSTNHGIARTVSTLPEMEMAFAGLHQLCAPFLDRLGRLPDPQRDALETAFSLRNGEAPDRFAVGLAALSLLSELAGDGALLCLIDDAHWLDRASADALLFALEHALIDVFTAEVKAAWQAAYTLLASMMLEEITPRFAVPRA